MKDSVFSLFVQIIEEWGLSSLFKVTKNPMEITCVNGNKIIFKGLDDPEKVKSINGITTVWIEESSELKKEDLQQLQLRVRGKHLKNPVEFIQTFNPINEHHWLKKMYFDQDQPNTQILKTTYLDNPFLDDGYIQTLENLKHQDETYYGIYALGLWGSLENLIYKNYVIESITIKDEDFDYLFYGMDYGFNDPTALVKVGILNDEIYILDELYKKELTNADLIKLMKEVEISKSIVITADSSEPARTTDIQREGYKIKGAKKGPGSIKHGIDFIKTRKIHIAPHCVNFTKEIQAYSYKKNKAGDVTEEPLANGNDHILDALRYALEDFRKARLPQGRARTLTKGMLGL